MTINFSALAEKYDKRYRTQMQDLAKSPLAKARGLEEMDVYGLGRMLATWERDYRNIREAANGSVANLGALPKVALDLLTAAYGTAPIAAVASVQPIPDMVGLVYFMNAVAQHNRGNVNAGDKFFSVAEPPEVYPDGYASDTVETVNYINASNGAQTYTAVDVGGSDDFSVHFDPQRCEISGSAIFNAGADTVNFATMIVNPDNGHFADAQVVNSTLYSVNGTVDFEAGTVTQQFSADPSGQTTFTIRYAVLHEEQTSIASQILTLDHKIVRAQWFALRGTYGFMENYTMNKRFGKNAESIMTKNLMTGVNNEIMNKILKKILAGVPVGNLVTWGRQPQTGVSYRDHKLSLEDALADANRMLLDSAGRGEVNVWIAGSKAATIISRLEGFKLLYTDNNFGPHIYGTFDGKTIVRVPDNAQLDAKTVIGVSRSPDGFEAPVVWAPYAPLTTTAFMPTGPNPFQQQQGAAACGAVETMLPNLSTKLVVDDTGFDYASNL